jgi:hypothetical protein
VRIVFVVIVALGLFGSSCQPMSTSRPTGEPMPEFSLSDVNPASPTSGQAIGPSTLRGKVTGWYFGHSS